MQEITAAGQPVRTVLDVERERSLEREIDAASLVNDIARRHEDQEINSLE